MTRAWRMADSSALAAAVALAAAWCWWAVHGSPLPSESAAPALRGAQALAAGRGFAWELGAGDFTFACAVAALARLGIGLEAAAALVGGAAHVAAAALVYVAVARVHRAPAPWAFLAAAALALGPGATLVAARSSATWTALLIALAWVLVEPPRPRRRAAILVAAALLACASAAAYVHAGRIAPSAAGLRDALHSATILTLPVWPLLVWGARDPRTRRRAVAALIPLAAFPLAGALCDGKLDYQYPLLPLALSAWPALLDSERLVSARRPLWLAAALCGVAVYWAGAFGRPLDDPTYRGAAGLHRAALVLAPYAPRGYALASSRCGILPLYAEWRAVGLERADLAARPEIIAYATPREDDQARRFAVESGYLPAGDWRPFPGYALWVRPDFPDARAIADGLRRLRFPGKLDVARDAAAR